MLAILAVIVQAGVSRRSPSSVAKQLVSDAKSTAGTINRQSMADLVARASKSGGRQLPAPIVTINFGSHDSPTRDGELKDYGLEYAEKSDLGLSWGWNCDLQRLSSTRDRASGEEYLRSMIIPDRHGNCKAPLKWEISLPAGDYTVAFSTTDTEDNGSEASSCTVQGIEVAQLPTENTCSTDSDLSCFILRNISVVEGTPLRLTGSYQQGCKSVNYIRFYEASDDVALGLSTFKTLDGGELAGAKNSDDAALDKFLGTIANDERDVIAASVNAGYIDFAENWLCSVSKMSLTNYFFIATGGF